MVERKPHTFGYIRRSTAKQDTTEQTQAEAIMSRYADSLKSNNPFPEWKGVFFDDGISRKKPINERPKGREMMNTLYKGDVLIVWKIDRIGGSSWGVLDFCNWCRRHEVRLIILNFPQMNAGGELGEVDFNSPMAPLYLAAMDFASHLESCLISDRTKAALATVKAKGVSLGPKPFPGWKWWTDGEGIKRQIKVDEEQDTIEYIFHLSEVQGLGRGKIQEVLKNDGHRRLDGSLWGDRMIRNVLEAGRDYDPNGNKSATFLSGGKNS